ncbi:hypothetical protein P3S68_029968 [Capsicum galapagoense]
MPSVQIQLKDCASPSNVKKKKIDRIESQPKSKSMSESPSSFHRMTRSQSQRLLGACKDEENDISKGKEKVWDSVVRPSDYYMTHVSVHTNCSIVNELKDKFTKVQLDLFRNTCFGYFSDLPPVCIQNQLIHGMLLREVLSSRSDEIWIQVNETKLQFGLSEFAVISGLKCTVSMYRRGGFPLAFQCWFYECCPYANDKLVVRVRDSVPRVLNWLVTQVVLTNIESTCIEKSILQLPVFEPVPQKEHTAFKKSDGSSDPSKEHMREDRHSIEYHNGHNVGLKNDDTYAGNPIGINLSDNVGRQTDGTPKVDHVSDNVVDGVGQKNIGVEDCIDVEAGNKLSANLVDDVEKENINVGDHIDVVAGDHISDNIVDDIGKKTVGVGDRIDTDAGDRPIIGDEWSAFSNFNFLKFTPSGNKIGEKVKNSFEDSWSNFPDYEVSKFMQPIFQENIQYMKDLVKNSQEIDWSVVPDSEISKYTQPDKIGEHFMIEKVVGKIDTNLGSTSVALVATEVFVDIGSVVPRRIRKSAAICESPYVSKFDSGCSNVQGQPTKYIDKGPSRKHIFSIKHPFTISITEPFLDMKLLSSFNKFVDKPLRLNSNPIYSKSVNNLANAFDYGVVTIKTKEWFYTLGYAEVPLTDSYILGYVMRYQLYSELIPNLLSSINFWDKRSDGIAAADSFDIRMVDVLPTQKNTGCGVFVAAFAEYMIEGIQIPVSLDDIDSIRSRYGALLWQYGKTK